MRASPIYTSFNAGELSPLLFGRPDLEKWRAGLELCQNFIPRVQGALVRRGGSRYVAAIKDQADLTFLIPFVFSALDSFVLEFGDGYVRFFRNRAPLSLSGTPTAYNGAIAYNIGDLVSHSGVNYYSKTNINLSNTPPNATHWHALTGLVYEVPTPYTTADLVAADGTCALRFTQSGDVVYITHPTHRTRKLVRYANTTWKLEELDTAGGPFLDQNIIENTTVLVGTGTLTPGSVIEVASTPGIFTSGDVGSLFYIEMQDGKDIRPWEPQKTIAVNDIRRSDGKYYKCTQIGAAGTPRNCGSVMPTHTSGKYWDGDGLDDPVVPDTHKFGAEWEYLHAGYGWGKITAYNAANDVDMTIISTIPTQVQGIGNATWRWARGAWSAREGWPSDVCFFRERLTFVKGSTVYTSKAGDFENFRATDHGEVTPASAVVLSVQSGRGDTVKWIAPLGDSLLVGTGGGELVVREQTSNQAFGPGNVTVEPQTEWGSNGVRPVVVGSNLLHVEKSGRSIREVGYDLNTDAFDSLDLTLFAEHLFPTTRKIVAMAFARQPNSVLWCVGSDGALLGFTYMKQQGVSGWHRHVLGGASVAVEAITVIPSPDGTRDDLWMIVKRTINGGTKRYVEWLTQEYEEGADNALLGYSDSHLVYDGSSTATITGLDHLEGQTVRVKADGVDHADRTVSSGSITLASAATKVIVGLRADAKMKTMPLDDGGMQASQGKNKRVNRVKLRLWAAQGGRCGPDFTTMETLQHPGSGLTTGDVDVEFPGGYDGRAAVAIEATGSQPFALVAMMPELTGYE